MDKRDSRKGCCRYDTRTQLLGDTRSACFDGDDLVGDTEGPGRDQRGGEAGGVQSGKAHPPGETTLPDKAQCSSREHRPSPSKAPGDEGKSLDKGMFHLKAVIPYSPDSSIISISIN